MRSFKKTFLSLGLSGLMFLMYSVNVESMKFVKRVSDGLEKHFSKILKRKSSDSVDSAIDGDWCEHIETLHFVCVSIINGAWSESEPDVFIINKIFGIIREFSFSKFGDCANLLIDVCQIDVLLSSEIIAKARAKKQLQFSVFEDSRSQRFLCLESAIFLKL